MKQTAIRIGEDLLMRINRLKYAWNLKTQEATIRKLIEICTKITNANSTTSFLSGGLKTTTSEGADTNGASKVEAGESSRCNSGGTPDPRKIKEVEEESAEKDGGK